MPWSKAKYGEIYSNLKRPVEPAAYSYGFLLPSNNTPIVQHRCFRNTIRRALAGLEGSKKYQPAAVVSGQTLNSDGKMFEYTQSRYQPDYFRPCLKIGGMQDCGRFFRQARRFFAGILADFKEKQRSPGGKRCRKTAFRHFSNKA